VVVSNTVRSGVGQPTQAGFLEGGVVLRRGVCTKVKPVVLHKAIVVKSVSRPRPVERISYHIDAPGPRAVFGVHNNSLANLVRGINERVFYTTNKGTLPKRPILGAFDNLAFQSDLKGFKVHPWTLDQVVESYSGRQRLRYAQAAESVVREPLNLKKDARVSTFIKAEKINFTSKPDPAPRVIQPRDPRFNVCFAQYIKPMEHLIYKAMGRMYKYPCVAKGFNALQTGDILAKKWALFDQPSCVGLDASRFDQHVSVDALKWTHSIYRKFCRDDEFNKILKAMYVNKGYGTAKDGRVKYKVEGCRMSGDMDTALGNCVLMVGITYSLCKKLGIRHELFDNGDDCIVIMESEDVDRFNAAVDEWYGNLGFTMKVEKPVYQLERIEFCQTHPVFDGESWRMVRNLVCLSKDMTSVISWDQLHTWWRAIGECGLALTYGIPVMEAFYSWLCRIGSDVGKVKLHPLYRCGMVNLAGTMKYKEMAITSQARLSFAAAFGISPDMQVALEQMYGQLDAPRAMAVLRTVELDHVNSPELFESDPWVLPQYCTQGGRLERDPEAELDALAVSGIAY